MSVSAFSNEYTATYVQKMKNCVATTVTYWLNGQQTTTQSSWTQCANRVIRWFHTRNSPFLIKGTTTKYLPASNYARGVFSMEWPEGIWRTPQAKYTGFSYVESRSPCNTNAGYTVFDMVPILSNLSVNLDSNLQNQATTECLLKLADGKASIGADLGEARQTADMLADGLAELCTLYRNARKGKVFQNLLRRAPTSRRAALDLANFRLELVYGWIPLMLDLQGTYDLLGEKLRPAMIIKATRNVSDESSTPANTSWDVSGNVRRIHTCQLHAQLDCVAARLASQAGLINPLEIAWELEPFSFVVDWGLPIGNVLGALSAVSGLSFVGGFTAVHAEGHVTAVQRPPNGTVATSDRKGVLDFLYHRRYGLSGFPLPAAYAKNPFSTGHIANALALWTQRHV